MKTIFNPYSAVVALMLIITGVVPSAGHVMTSGFTIASNQRTQYLHRSANLDEIVRKTKSLYASTKTARLQFEQQGMGTTVSGTLTYAQGNKFRLELPQQILASNGEKTWTYLKERNQLVVTKAASGGQITPNDILTSFPGNYRTELEGETKVAGHSVWIIRCTPSSSGAIGDISEATLYIDKKSYRFRQIAVQSPTLGKVTLKITSAQYNISVPASQFTIAASGDTKVIDMTR